MKAYLIKGFVHWPQRSTFVNGGFQTKDLPCVLALKSNVWCPPKGRRTLILCGYYKINMIVVVAADVFELLGNHARGKCKL